MVKRKLEDFENLTVAEQKIRDEIDSGQIIKLGNGSLPDINAGDERKVSAEFIRYLALGGCDKCRAHEKGIMIEGAIIEGILDLEGCVLDRSLVLARCHVLDMPNLARITLDTLSFACSHLHNGLMADGLEAKGDVFLQQVEASRGVRLLGAELGGDLYCDGATFDGTKDREGHAFSIDGLEAKGSLFFQQVFATGAVRLVGIKLSGSLFCDGTTIFCRQKDSYGNATALDLQNAIIQKMIALRNLGRIVGTVNLSSATVGQLIDDMSSWPSHGDLVLNHFSYGAFPVEPVDAKNRLEWLARQNPSKFRQNFWPQPYEQLAKVLREMGHEADARKVLIEKEKLQRAARRKPMAWFRRFFYWCLDEILNVTMRYGRRPLLAFAWLSIFWSIGVIVFNLAAMAGAFSATSEGLPKFNTFIYSADTLLPIIDFGMQNAWMPNEDVKQWGLIAQYYLWFQIAIGWGLSLLAVAGFSGLVKSD